MNGDGISEIIVGWQIGTGVNMLSVYSIRDYQLTELASTDYTKYTVCDMNRDGNDDLIITRLSSSDTDGEVEMLSIAENSEVIRSNARLSNGVNSLLRIRTTPLSNGTPAILIEGALDNTSITTDIFVYQEDSLANITLNPATGRSDDTARTFSAYPYAQDINGDGVIEIPLRCRFYSPSEATNYWLIDWRAYDAKRQLFHCENNIPQLFRSAGSSPFRRSGKTT